MLGAHPRARPEDICAPKTNILVGKSDNEQRGHVSGRNEGYIEEARQGKGTETTKVEKAYYL